MFNLRAENNETVLTSERYVSKQSAEGGVASVKGNAPFEANYRRMSANGAPYFVLLASNGQVIGTSEFYASASGRDAGIEWVKKNAAGAQVKDNT